MRELQDDLLSLCSMTDKAIAKSLEALRTQDVSVARQVIEDDDKINAARWNLEESANLLIATQAPTAGDLRRVLATIHIAVELERMADYADGTAKLTLRTASEPLLKPLLDLPRMSDLCREMLREAIDAFIESDAERARQIARRDDEVDRLYEQIYRELLTYMISDPGTVPRATYLLWIAHNYERMGDRVTNICERIILAVTGELEELG
jgi:phosphate transport system protein